jgi:hypothetical protein
MLFSERKRTKSLIEKEAKGEPVWTSSVPKPLRIKFMRTIVSYGWVANKFDTDFGSDEISKLAHTILIRDIGVVDLGHNSRAPVSDLKSHILSCSDEDFPDIIEALALAINWYANDGIREPDALEKFRTSVNDLLGSYRVNYSLEGHEVIEFDSREMHVSVVSPVLILLSEPEWGKVEKAYQDSLRQLVTDPANAITDATTALQEALRKLGCKGADFASLMRSAKSALFTGYDTKYIQAIENLVDWSSAVRANLGDSHKITEATKEDAWFVIHTIGILILRLASQKKT